MRKFIIGAFAAVLSSISMGAEAYASNLVADINLSSQTMTVSENGFVKYRWKVSTARKGYVTPIGRYTAQWTAKMHRSRKYHNSPMPHSVFFKGGYAVHGTYEIKNLGRPASHGCIRLHPENAAIFYQLTRNAGLANTKIVISR